MFIATLTRIKILTSTAIICVSALICLAEFAFSQSGRSNTVVSSALSEENYTSRAAAERYIENLKPVPGQRAEIVENTTRDYSLIIGPFNTLDKVENTTGVLKSAGIPFRLVQSEETLSYTFLLATFSSEYAAERSPAYQIASKYFLDIEIEETRSPFYKIKFVTETVIERSNILAETGVIAGETKNESEPPKQSASNLHEHRVHVRQEKLKRKKPFSDLNAAIKYKRELRTIGYPAIVSKEKRTLDLINLQLVDFEQYSDAKRVEQRLNENGIDALILRRSDGKGFYISVGAYAVKENAEYMYKQLQQLGYGGIIVSLIKQSTVASYAVTIRTKDAELANRIQEEEIKKQEQPFKPEPQVLSFGTRAFPGEAPGLGALVGDAPSSPISYGIEKLLLQSGEYSQSPIFENQTLGRSDLFFGYKPDSFWEVYVETRATAINVANEGSEFDLDLGENYLRLRSRNSRLTTGWQTVTWGRLDGVAPSDRFSRLDVRIPTLDGVDDLRASVFSIRYEHYFDSVKIDAIWQPDFSPAKLPAQNSPWALVSIERGEALGVITTPLQSLLIQNATFSREEVNAQQFGVRLSRNGRGYDYGITAGQFNRNLPFYDIANDVLEALLSGVPVEQILGNRQTALFIERHPRNTFLGADVSFTLGAASLRMEAAYYSDEPLVDAQGQYQTAPSYAWGLGADFNISSFFDTRVTLQINGSDLLDVVDGNEAVETLAFLGSIESFFSRDKFKLSIDFNVETAKDGYTVNPEIAYISAKGNEFYLSGHIFDGGGPLSFGGYYRDQDFFSVGFRATF